MHTIFSGSLSGKTALVTGVGSGIGKSTAKLFGYCGARVAVLTRSRDEAEATCEEIRHGGSEAIALNTDISKGHEMQQAFSEIQRTWGHLDMVVANAGINGVWAPLEQIEEEEWEKVMDVNLKGTYLTVKNAIPLLKDKGGSIVIVASVNGTRIFSNAGASAYATSKAGQLAFSRMMALELAKHRIRCNVVCPGAIDTRIDANTDRRNLEEARIPVEYPEGSIPLTQGGPGTAGQVAELIWFLSSDLASHVTGAEVFIDGAESLLQG